MLPLLLLFVSTLLGRTDAIGYLYWKLPFNWTYKGSTGPSNWCRLGYSECCGDSQSPINLIPQDFISSTDNIKLSNYDRVPDQIHIENLADTVKFSFSTPLMPNISFGGPITYVFDNAHFHWGSRNNIGSEHTVNGFRYPMEAHLVHRNSIYSTADEASKNPHGIVVLSTFFQISDSENMDLRHLLHDLKHVRYAEQQYNDSQPFSLARMLPPMDRGYTYYTYNGSLTTPPCHQTVRWIILRHHVDISQRQMEFFRQLQAEPKQIDPQHNRPLVDNFRPVQPLNRRKIFYSNLPFVWP